MARTDNPEQKMTILIGYDGSECATDAVKDLAHAGLPDTGQAIVMAIANESSTPVAAYSPAAASLGDFNWATPGTWQELIDAANRDAEQTARSGATLVKSALYRWDVSVAHDIDSPYRALIEEARSREVDLVIVGSHGRSSLGRFFLGSTSQLVLSHASCSVRIGRPSKASAGAPLRILIAIDGSAGGAAAVREVGQRRWPAGTEVRVVTAVDLQLTAAMRRSHHADRHHSVVGPTVVVEAAVKQLRDAGLTATSAVEEGDPKRVIVDEANGWGADSIFVGATGHGRFERFLLGSVSSAVAARASCSVEVVRPPAR